MFNYFYFLVEDNSSDSIDLSLLLFIFYLIFIFVVWVVFLILGIYLIRSGVDRDSTLKIIFGVILTGLIGVIYYFILLNRKNNKKVNSNSENLNKQPE